MVLPNAETLATNTLAEKIRCFVDEMSGGISPFDLQESMRVYRVVGDVGPVLVDEVEFSTIIDKVMSRAAGETHFIRTMSMYYDGFRKEQI